MCAAFFAGAVDSIVGGGGLIQLPALLILLPTFPVPTLMGTNKFAFIFGTGTAAFRYTRHVELPWRTVLLATGSAGVAAYFGGRCVSLLNPTVLKPLILILLVLVAVWTFKKKELGDDHRPHLSHTRELIYAVFLGLGLGFYDGFFGPGSGSFIIFILIGVFGFSFLHATASTRLINCATNLGAVIFFAMTDQIIYSLGLAMAFANAAGAYTGSHVAIQKGSRFVRVAFLWLLTLLILRLGWQVYNEIGQYNKTIEKISRS